MKYSSQLSRIMIVFALTWLAIVALTPHVAQAATDWYVAPVGSDNNDCLSNSTPCATINGAIGKAAPNDTIRVASGTYTVALGSEVVLLNQSVFLSGGWDSTFAVQNGMTVVDAQETRRGIMVNPSVAATIDHFTIQNGYDYYMVGGGLYNQGTLTITHSLVTGSVLHSGGIANYNTLVIEKSVIAHNSGYGISNNSLNSPGVTLVISGSSVSENIGSSAIGGGIANDNGVITMTNTTVSRNSNGVSRSGGIDNHGHEGSIVINNSTIAQNASASRGGGLANWLGTILINNSTIAQNVAATGGGGIDNDHGSVTLQNTILSGNMTNAASSDCFSNYNSGSYHIYSEGYNLIGNVSGCNFIASTGDITSTDARLGLLVGLPGNPQYLPLLLGSAAIDAGNPSGCMGSAGTLSADQRGAPRVGRCDIGAYEYTVPGQAASIYAFSGTPQKTPRRSLFKLPLQAMVLDSIGTPVSDTVVSFSAPLSGASGVFVDTGVYTTSVVAFENGLASAAPFLANDILGAYTVTATIGITSTADFLLNNLFGAYLPLIVRQ